MVLRFGAASASVTRKEVHRWRQTANLPRGSSSVLRYVSAIKTCGRTITGTNKDPVTLRAN
ncbi:hypothetical protein [Ktedonospora formicarum]|uniref:hypothetical protein n=1 Tax=Ktedonospora formicarum TaxID=2778364 RepID=UPI001C68C7F0|nr:hypothetical protein [Ktedonospora formicarum]